MRVEFRGLLARLVFWAMAVACCLPMRGFSADDQAAARGEDAVGAVLKINGIVRDGLVGRPIAVATVTVFQEIGTPPEQKSVQRFELVTDADGRYRFDWRTDDAQNPAESVQGNDSPVYYFRIVAKHPDYFPGNSRSSVAIQPPEMLYPDGFARRNFSDDPAGRRLGSIELRPGKPVTGFVQTQDGKPLAGVKVVAHSRAPNLSDMTVEVENAGAPSHSRVVTSPPVTDDTLTDENGRFTVTMVTPGLGMLSIEPEKDYAPAKYFVYDQRGDVGVIKLERGGVIRGRLVDVDGKPHAKVQVNAYPWNLAEARISDRYNDQYSIDEEVHASALTDAEGNFTMGRLPAGDYRVEPVAHGRSIRNESGQYQSEYPVPGMFVPQKVKLTGGEDPPAIELRGVPTITIQGHASVETTSGPGAPRSGTLFLRGGSGATVQGIYGGQTFGVTLTTDNDGSFSAVVPKGMSETVIELPSIRGRGNFGPSIQMQWRLGPDAPLQSASRIRLGTLDKDFRDLEIVQVQRQRTAEEMQQLLQAEVESGGMSAEQAALMLQTFENNQQVFGPGNRGLGRAGQPAIGRRGSGRGAVRGAGAPLQQPEEHDPGN